MRILIATVLLIASQVSASADQSVVVGSVTTPELVQRCRSAGNTLLMDCAGYIIGVFDQMSVSHFICPPRNLNVVTAQAVAVALKFLNEHPEQWHMAPEFLIGQSFKTAFSCGARQD